MIAESVDLAAFDYADISSFTPLSKVWRFAMRFNGGLIVVQLIKNKVMRIFGVLRHVKVFAARLVFKSSGCVFFDGGKKLVESFWIDIESNN